MILQLAWKNIWRNKVRSSIVIGAIALGLFAGTFMTSFISGWMQHQVDLDINNQISHIQIHQEIFLDNYDINDYFLRSDVEPVLKSNDSIEHVTYRVKLVGMLASAANAAGLNINAVDVPEEILVSNLYENIPDTSGNFLQDGKPMRIVISKRTAEKLKVKLNSKVVLSFQDTSGTSVSLAFRVGGLFKTTNSVFDEGNVFVKKSDIFELTGLPIDAVHEAAIMLNKPEACEQIRDELRAALPGMKVQDWKDMSPMLKLSAEWQGFMSTFILGIFLFALAFGIINTMLMAVLERTKEIGMLMAIGMSKRKIFRMIMMESILLTAVGSIIGVIIALIIIVFTAKNGIDLYFLMGENFEDFGFGSIIYPALSGWMFVQIAVLVVICGIVSAIYPARKALNLNPLDAIAN